MTKVRTDRKIILNDLNEQNFEQEKEADSFWEFEDEPKKNEVFKRTGSEVRRREWGKK